MTLDLDTFLTIVYCMVDTAYQAEFASARPSRPGPRPELHDSEVLTLMLVAQWHPSRSERKVGRYAVKHWRSYFPRLLSQSQFNRRARDLHGVFARLAPLLAEQVIATLSLDAPYEVLDGVPVPLMARCRGNRHRCFASEASIGCGGSDREWYYGMQLLLTVTPCGLITGFTLGPGAGALWAKSAGWRMPCCAGAPTQGCQPRRWPNCGQSCGPTTLSGQRWGQPDRWDRQREPAACTGGHCWGIWASPELDGSSIGAEITGQRC
jgi:hypothetical protein